ncbi:hypothetical protein A7U60_g5232 [Sanghuangporus baumii]|uniref:BTB domain-containing protein n=1 Tax=Sanghuangporus baumii TaxID=108892 RepID=A0A9Q5N8D6_SANBA|nr:hypothetical protein A7U60_g5232 [Sanghuangporus baumii]
MSSDTEKELSEEQTPKPELKFHPDYDDQESDLMLESADGKRFCVHSLIMKLASDVFKTMIDVAPAQVSSKEPIHVQEKDDVIKDLLDAIYPNKLSFLDGPPTFEHFKDVCYAAEKYEMIGALQTMQFFFRRMIDSFPPLLAFAVASRYEWTEELHLTSIATLKLDLYSPQSVKELQFIPSGVLLKLMELHRKRRNLLVASLDLDESRGVHSIGWSSVTLDKSSCTRPSSHFTTPRWTVLKYRLSEEMERKPDGSSIRGDDFWNRSEFDKIWEIECSGFCRSNGGILRIMSKDKLKAQVLQVLDDLPKTIQ